MVKIRVVAYITRTGKEPFGSWYRKLDYGTQSIIQDRLDRVSIGNFGDIKPVKNGDGVKELRIHYGPGYRLYIAFEDQAVVILLIGGTKNSQDQDIEKAKKYWNDFQEQQ